MSSPQVSSAQPNLNLSVNANLSAPLQAAFQKLAAASQTPANTTMFSGFGQTFNLVTDVLDLPLHIIDDAVGFVTGIPPISVFDSMLAAAAGKPDKAVLLNLRAPIASIPGLFLQMAAGKQPTISPSSFSTLNTLSDMMNMGRGSTLPVLQQAKTGQGLHPLSVLMPKK